MVRLQADISCLALRARSRVSRARSCIALAPLIRLFCRLRPSWNFGFVFFSFSHSLQFFNKYACAKILLMSIWHGLMADGEEFMWWKISTNTVHGYKTDTKCVHSVRGRPTLKDEERFRNGLVRKPYERSLYEWTFMSELFIEKHAISTELCNVNREKHKLKSHRVCRRDREPSRIPIRSLKSLRNKSRKVREFVYARILSCFPIALFRKC